MSDFFPNIPSRRTRPTPKKIVRILLGEASSKLLDDTGLPAFGVCGCEREAGKPTRWVLYLAETRHPSAQQAIELIKSTAAKESPLNPSKP